MLRDEFNAWCLKKKIQIYQIYANFYSSKTSVASYDFAYEYEYLFRDSDREMDSN